MQELQAQRVAANRGIQRAEVEQAKRAGGFNWNFALMMFAFFLLNKIF